MKEVPLFATKGGKRPGGGRAERAQGIAAIARDRRHRARSDDRGVTRCRCYRPPEEQCRTLQEIGENNFCR